MHTANYIVRRIIAWPLLVVGLAVTTIGGALIKLGAWAVDEDTSDTPLF